jgi:hypothetical protein
LKVVALPSPRRGVAKPASDAKTFNFGQIGVKGTVFPCGVWGSTPRLYPPLFLFFAVAVEKESL